MAMSPPAFRRCSPRPGAFTLLEMLVATAVFLVILASAFAVFDQSSKAIRNSSAKIDSFQAARAAFDIMARKLSQATLNTYWDYYDAAGTPYRLAANPVGFVPTRYGRYSDLHFISGASAGLLSQLPPKYTATAGQAVFYVAPLGLTGRPDVKDVQDTLNACGFFIAFGSDEEGRPGFIQRAPSYRWRLLELNSPTEAFTTMQTSLGTGWFTDPVKAGAVRPVAENVIALIIWPRLPSQEDPAGTTLSPDFQYDSRTSRPWTGSPPRQDVQAHQLPPVLQMTMVVLDEKTAKRWENSASPPAEITGALSGLFENDVTKVQDNLAELEKRLIAKRADYRIFNTSIALRESKWSP